MTQKMAAECLDLARRHNLLVTIGSDFHGDDTRRFGYYGGGINFYAYLLRPAYTTMVNQKQDIGKLNFIRI